MASDLTDIALDNLERELMAHPAPKSEFCADTLAETRFHLHVQAAAMIAEIKRRRISDRAMRKRINVLAESMSDDHPRDRPSIAALQQLVTQVGADHPAVPSAVPVLLEIVAAALALRDQEDAASAARWPCSILNPNASPTDEQRSISHMEDMKLARRMSEYAVALRKVRP